MHWTHASVLTLPSHVMYRLDPSSAPARHDFLSSSHSSLEMCRPDPSSVLASHAFQMGSIEADIKVFDVGISRPSHQSFCSSPQLTLLRPVKSRFPNGENRSRYFVSCSYLLDIMISWPPNPSFHSSPLITLRSNKSRCQNSEWKNYVYIETWHTYFSTLLKKIMDLLLCFSYVLPRS